MKLLPPTKVVPPSFLAAWYASRTDGYTSPFRPYSADMDCSSAAGNARDVGALQKKYLASVGRSFSTAEMSLSLTMPNTMFNLPSFSTICFSCLPMYWKHPSLCPVSRITGFWLLCPAGSLSAVTTCHLPIR